MLCNINSTSFLEISKSYPWRKNIFIEPFYIFLKSLFLRYILILFSYRALIMDIDFSEPVLLITSTDASISLKVCWFLSSYIMHHFHWQIHMVYICMLYMLMCICEGWGTRRHFLGTISMNVACPVYRNRMSRDRKVGKFLAIMKFSQTPLRSTSKMQSHSTHTNKRGQNFTCKEARKKKVQEREGIIFMTKQHSRKS